MLFCMLRIHQFILNCHFWLNFLGISMQLNITNFISLFWSHWNRFLNLWCLTKIVNRNIDFGSVWTVASRYIALLQRRWTKKKNGGGALALLYVLVGTTIYKTLKLNRFVASSKHLHLLSGCLCFVEIIRCYLGGTH